MIITRNRCRVGILHLLPVFITDLCIKSNKIASMAEIIHFYKLVINFKFAN